MDNLKKIIRELLEYRKLSEVERVEIYNKISEALKIIVEDISKDPVISVQLVPVDDIIANDYNPNTVATPEMELLRDSIEQDGITMPVVVYQDKQNKQYIIVDGFHRDIVIKQMGKKYMPISIIEKDIGNRIASTIRHNRARGKHQTELMAGIVKRLLKIGWNDDKIIEHIGMTSEELMRMKQVVKVAEVLAAPEVSKAWGVKDAKDIFD